MRVLIAEDDILHQLLFGRYMRKLGWDHTIVANGQLAVNACMSGNFNVILMDINMPLLNGIEATKRIRSFNKLIPVIAISAYTDSDAQKKCKKAGINAIIDLPTSCEIIRDIVIKYAETD